MNQGPDGEEQAELVCTVGGLRVTIAGPAVQAAELLQKVVALGAARRSGSPGTSELSFDLVSEPASAVGPATRQLETRAEIEATFRGCPGQFLESSNRLGGSQTSGEGRVRRAWTAGLWAKAVAAGRIHSPNRTPRLDLRPRVYAILRAPGLEKATLCRSARTYWEIIGDLQSSSSISHAFPSELEAKIYFSAAGAEDFAVRD